MNSQSESFGEFIKKLRKAQGFTLAQLAERSGVSQPFLSQIENNKRKPSPEILKKIFGPLNYSYSSLLVRAGILDKQAELEAITDAINIIELELYVLNRKYHELEQKGVSLDENNEFKLLAEEIHYKKNQYHMLQNKSSELINFISKEVTELHDIFESTKISLNGKILTDEEKSKLLKIAETMFFE